MNDDLLALALPFDKSVEAAMTKGGTSLTYIPVSEVIHRLNEVLAYNWGYTVVSCQRDALDPEYVVAHVSMKVYNGGPDNIEPAVREGYGGVKIKRTRDGGLVDLGDEYKGAVSDALKKAAQAFGVGLYLARHEDKPTPSTERRPIQSPTPSAYKGENIKALFPDAQELTGDITVKGDQHGELPNWLYGECVSRGITHVYDNRDGLAANPKRPWFKCVDTGTALWAPKGTPLPVIIPPIIDDWDTPEEPF